MQRYEKSEINIRICLDFIEKKYQAVFNRLYGGLRELSQKIALALSDVDDLPFLI